MTACPRDGELNHRMVGRQAGATTRCERSSEKSRGAGESKLRASTRIWRPPDCSKYLSTVFCQFEVALLPKPIRFGATRSRGESACATDSLCLFCCSKPIINAITMLDRATPFANYVNMPARQPNYSWFSFACFQSISFVGSLLVAWLCMAAAACIGCLHCVGML